MTPLAGDWWASGSLWQFVITIISGIAVGVLGAWATLRSSDPKRKVVWWVQSNTPLIRPDEDRTVAVTLQGLPLNNPRVVELVIANQGSRDITADMFHANDSMRFDFGVYVCKILDIATQPGGSVRPSLEAGPYRLVASGTVPSRVEFSTWVEFAPSLLSRGQVVTVTVLVDGYAPQVVCVSAPLVDVQVREGTERMPPTPQASFDTSVRRLALAFVAGSLFVLLAVWLPAL
jgi:hypothetical protein